MTREDVERIARAALKDLGAPSLNITVSEVAGRPGHWRIAFPAGGTSLHITCGEGSTAQWVRAQVTKQYLAN